MVVDVALVGGVVGVVGGGPGLPMRMVTVDPSSTRSPAGGGTTSTTG